MAQIREIKKRMVAVRTIQRITKTMQMIATAKFTAALQRAKATRPYTERIRELVAEVSAAAGDVDNPLLGVRSGGSGNLLAKRFCSLSLQIVDCAAHITEAFCETR